MQEEKQIIGKITDCNESSVRAYEDQRRVVEILLGGSRGIRKEEDCQATSLCHLDLEKKNTHKGKEVVGVSCIIGIGSLFAYQY